MIELKRNAVMLAALCAASLISPLAAVAQSSNQATTKQKQATQRIPFQTVSQEPNNLPYIASVAPPGGKLISAMKSSTAKRGRMTLILRYGCADTPANTLRYYADTLQKAKWKIGMQNGKQLVAAYKNYSLAATAYSASQPGYRGDLQIIYQMPADDQ